MVKTLVACMGKRLEGRELLELCNNEIFSPCLLCKIVLGGGDYEMAVPL